MLDELRLVSVSGIKNATLAFGGGLIAVTGESGAGKSSLVRGLELICGRRNMGSPIRSGDDAALAEAFFSLDGRLEGLEESMQPQDGSICLRRELSRGGRGKSSIQGQTVPLNLLSETAPKLISIQSQFAQLELLAPDRQLEILDACGGGELSATKARLEKVFHEVIDCERSLRALRAREQEIVGRYGGISQIAPLLKRLQLMPESEEKMNADYESAERDLKRLRELRSRLRILKNSEGGGLIDEIWGVLEGLAHFVPSENCEEIDEASQKIRDGLDQLSGRLAALAPSEKIENLESELERLETALGAIRKCKRLARVSTLSELLEYWRRGEEATEWLSQSSKIQTETGEKMAAAKREVAQAARALHELRMKAADELQHRVTENLAGLAMENTQFRLQVIETNKLRAQGAERVEFVLSRGGQEIPVAKAASGGELSRILLAIQLSLPDEMMPPTLVFDEVEAGLGGRAAYLTGLKLRGLADRVQVILITHEASIAALAKQHYRVERTGDLSKFEQVDGEERVREIARMLSGTAGEEEALVHARKLLQNPAADDRISFDAEKNSH